MDSNQFSIEATSQLRRTFFGQVPDSYSLINASMLSDYYKVMEKYITQNVYHINYAQLIEDVLNAISPQLIKALKKKKRIADELVSDLKKNNRILLGSLYYKMQLDSSITCGQKYINGYFIYHLIYHGTKIYRIELIDDQQEFLADLLKHGEQNLAKWKIENGIQDNKYSKLEQNLKNANLLESTSSIIPVLSSVSISETQKANWLGQTSQLIYLIYRLAENKDDIHNQSIYKFTSERFLIKGKQPSSKSLNTAMNNIQNNYISVKNRKELPQHLTYIDTLIA